MAIINAGNVKIDPITRLFLDKELRQIEEEIGQEVTLNLQSVSISQAGHVDTSQAPGADGSGISAILKKVSYANVAKAGMKALK